MDIPTKVARSYNDIVTGKASFMGVATPVATVSDSTMFHLSNIEPVDAQLCNFLKGSICDWNTFKTISGLGIDIFQTNPLVKSEGTSSQMIEMLQRIGLVVNNCKSIAFCRRLMPACLMSICYEQRDSFLQLDSRILASMIKLSHNFPPTALVNSFFPQKAEKLTLEAKYGLLGYENFMVFSMHDVMSMYLKKINEVDTNEASTALLRNYALEWMVPDMIQQLHLLARDMVLVESPHPIYSSILDLSPSQSHNLRVIRNRMVEFESSRAKRKFQQAYNHLVQATSCVLDKANDATDHAKRCLSALENARKYTQMNDGHHECIVPSEATDFRFNDDSSRQNGSLQRQLLAKIEILKTALEEYEENIIPTSYIPLDTVIGKKVCIPSARSLLIEFDGRASRTSWKLTFYSDAECTRRIPWILSRDGFSPILIPSNYFYYSFEPYKVKQHFFAGEWGYAFRVVPYLSSIVTDANKIQKFLGWECWSWLDGNTKLQDSLLSHHLCTKWMQAILRYIRAPAAPYKLLFMRIFTQLLLRLRIKQQSFSASQSNSSVSLPISHSIHTILGKFYCIQPELNAIFNNSIENIFKLHFNSYFQGLLQLINASNEIVSAVEKRRGHFTFDEFGFHATQQKWQANLLSSIKILESLLKFGRVDSKELLKIQTLVSTNYNPFAMLKRMIKIFEASIKPEVCSL